MKIITTGNPNYGLAAAIKGSSYASRSNGYDLSTDEGMNKFCHIAAKHDVIIINCYTDKMNNYSQVRLLHKQYELIQKSTSIKHIICIGSIADHINKEQPWIKYISYGAEKLALQRLCQTINHNREAISPNIKCTYISLGHMHTPLVDRYHPKELKLDTKYVAEVIDWIIKAPECIEEITITKHK